MAFYKATHWVGLPGCGEGKVVSNLCTWVEIVPYWTLALTPSTSLPDTTQVSTPGTMGICGTITRGRPLPLRIWLPVSSYYTVGLGEQGGPPGRPGLGSPEDREGSGKIA